MAERTAARSTSQGSVHHQPAHCLSGELAASAKLKAFRLREMPTGVLERTLSSTHPNVKKAIAAGFRLRAVRWSSNDDAYVFNSRLGQPIFIDQVETLEVYNTTSFPIMEDNRPGFSSRPRPIQAASVQHFKFNGPQPTVQQFLVGMGDVELEDPNAKPVPTEEARQYMQRPEFGPTATTGRARVPRARAQSTSSSDDKSDSDFGDGNVFESQGVSRFPAHRRPKACDFGDVLLTPLDRQHNNSIVVEKCPRMTLCHLTLYYPLPPSDRHERLCCRRHKTRHTQT